MFFKPRWWSALLRYSASPILVPLLQACSCSSCHDQPRSTFRLAGAGRSQSEASFADSRNKKALPLKDTSRRPNEAAFGVSRCTTGDCEASFASGEV
jgi:hypothetical protein